MMMVHKISSTAHGVQRTVSALCKFFQREFHLVAEKNEGEVVVYTKLIINEKETYCKIRRARGSNCFPNGMELHVKHVNFESDLRAGVVNDSRIEENIKYCS